MANYGPHQYLCSKQGSGPVKIKHTSISRVLRTPGRLARIAQLLGVSLALLVTAGTALAQGSNTIDSIRVIGNRRIPKETVLARLFTHPGDAYDPISIERDFNSLWNTGYFENLRIEREDSDKGIILDIFVKEKPTIREINYKGLNAVSQSDVLDRFKKEKVGLTVESQYDAAKILRATTVLKDILSEHGHQFAIVKLDIKDIPPASVQVNFNIKEGPTVKVGNIKFVGNQHLSGLILRRSMKNLKPIGIPYSIILEDIFPQTFDASKLEEDTERVRLAYRDKGYANAAIEEPKTQIRDEGGLNWFTFRPNKGKRIDILMPVEEGARYRLGTITFTGNKAVSNTKALRGTFVLKDGDWFNATMIQKGLENLKKAYGQLGYINFGAIPKPIYDDQKKTVSLEIDIDEGKPFYVSRIEFQGNTITRDKVIRRELMLDEGSVYNSQLWEYSLLRLNQLEYFEALKVDQDSEAHQDAEAGTVDLLLKVKEKGKNSIGLNGGVSGLSGAFLGVNYQTNNFLGLGETLSLQGNLGNVSRQFMFGFSQPYLKNRPLNLGFQLFNTKQDYNASKSYQTTSGLSANLTAAQQSLTQNYNQASQGLTLSLSYPLKRHAFQRIGMTYSPSRTSPLSRQPRRPSSRPSASGPAFKAATRWRVSSTATPRSATSTTPSTTLSARAVARNTQPFSRSPALAATCVTSHRWWPTSASCPCITSFRRPVGATSSGCAHNWVMSRALAETSPLPTIASTPAAKAIFAASIFAALPLTATSPIASPCSSPIQTAPAFRAIPPILS